MNDTRNRAQRGENGHRKGPPPLHEVMEAVAAQVRDLLQYNPLFVNRADLDDPFQRPDQWEAAGKLLRSHGGSIRLGIARIPGPHPYARTYALSTFAGVNGLSTAGRDVLEALSGGLHSWGSAEQTPVVEVFTGELDDQGDPVSVMHGTGRHLHFAIGPDHPLPEGVDIISIKTISSRAELAHTMRYGHKGYDSEMNSALHDFAAGSFTPPCPVLLALGVHRREQVRREVRLLKATGQRKSVSFPATRYTLHAPRPGRRVRYMEVSSPDLLPTPDLSLTEQSSPEAWSVSDTPPEAQPRVPLPTNTIFLTRLLKPRRVIHGMNRQMRRVRSGGRARVPGQGRKMMLLSRGLIQASPQTPSSSSVKITAMSFAPNRMGEYTRPSSTTGRMFSPRSRLKPMAS